MRRFLAASAVTLALALGGCNDQYATNGRSLAPIPPKTVALMSEKGMAKSDPILVRVYKKESELELWKQKGSGEYALLKTFPICRWSGQLGPKVREGDRQSPEGFYTITPAQMNPNSSFYLSFDTGFPNAYDKALGRSGSYLMVHGTCSSRGCYAMTDEGISEVYALAREAFNGGQRGFQFQAYPFRLTAENLAKHRHDPNMAFWKNLKEGSDTFEVTKREPKVAVCGGRYAFDTVGMTCKTEPGTAQLVAEKDDGDRRQVAELVAKGLPSTRLVYADGSGHESFRATATGTADGSALFAAPQQRLGDVSRPDALAAGPQEIAMDEPRAPASAKSKGAVSLAAAKPKLAEPATVASLPAASSSARPARLVMASADPDEPLPALAGPSLAEKPFYERVLGGVFSPGGAPKVAAEPAPAADAPAAAPVPPRRTASAAVKPAVAAAKDATPAATSQVKSKPASSAETPKPRAALATPRHADLSALPGAQPLGPSTSAFGRN